MSSFESESKAILREWLKNDSKILKKNYFSHLGHGVKLQFFVKFEAKRVGVAKPGLKAARPVKVVLRSGAIARQVIGKAAKLRDVEKYDRTPGQRDERRILVTELKRRRAEEWGAIKESLYPRGNCSDSKIA